MSSPLIPRVLPAQLSFLAVYNPSLGPSDEKLQDQIVFYYSKAAKSTTKINGDATQDARDVREQENEKLRQVGLAQGMVGFARGFSNGEAVDSVETEKSRIVIHELEPGWWILASIDLTQLPAATPKADGGSSEPQEPATEYSSREVSPPALLQQQLVRANSVFLLHHGSTLQGLFTKLGREKFCNTMDKFWSRFATHWDVLLHGSPAVDIFRGMKLAAGGELGMGVGEEEWGSGERDVLEDFARRTDGLVDMMVARFGEPSPHHDQTNTTGTLNALDASQLDPWIGRGRHVNAGDGIVFSGVGALSRGSLRVMSHWMEDIYALGEYAYGVKDSPRADRRKRRRRNPTPAGPQHSETETIRAPKSNTPAHTGLPPGIPPPIVKAAQSSLDKASEAVDSAKSTEANQAEPKKTAVGDTEAWMKYLTLGYGTAWGGKHSHSSKRDPSPRGNDEGESPEVPMRHVDPEPDIDRGEEKLRRQIQQENSGYFSIGLKGSLEDEDVEGDDEGDWNNRIPLRTVHVELVKDIPDVPGGADDESSIAYIYDEEPSSKSTKTLTRLRPVVYVHRPFIYTFLFQQRTESLTLATFYRNLHTYFSPLHRALSSSTSPDKVGVRLSAASHPYTTTSSATGSAPNTEPIYDLVFDPRTLTVHSSLPNIPEPGALVQSGWSRVEALNVHSQILATVAGTRRTFSEIERTCKTSRGWWVVWMRLPPSSVDASTESDEAEEADPGGFRVADLREAFLVRRAHDGASSSTKYSGSGLGSGMWRLGGPSTGEKMGGAAAGWGPRGLAEGIGIDARRYVEGLLSLNR